MKWLKNNWYKLLNVALIVVLGVYVCCFALDKAKNYQIYTEPAIDSKIYTIWHVETFEGGGKARITYLNKIARNLEKQNDGILFMIKQIEADKLESLLKTSTPDMISFGFGVGKNVLPHLKELDKTYDVRDELVASGSFNNRLYCLPYIMSGYTLITHGAMTQNVHCGITGYTKPSVVCEDIRVTPVESESQYEAYKDFVYNKNVTLVGTGRDLFRVNNLNNIGRTNASFTPIDTYTDLVQYFGLCTVDNYTTTFLSCVLDDTNQQSLYDYALFSSKYNKLYATGIYNDMENAIMSASVPNCFDD
ncbi:MAG: hypothetical protein IKM43_03630 [Clostridia bacterium]|nr:hypothetical protein [Clostridia bacterium]